MNPTFLFSRLGFFFFFGGVCEIFLPNPGHPLRGPVLVRLRRRWWLVLVGVQIIVLLPRDGTAPPMSRSSYTRVVKKIKPACRVTG